MITVKLFDELGLIVDKEDYPKVSKFHWYLDDEGYARTNIWEDGKKIAVHRIHRIIIPNVEEGLHIDHINGNKLDNRKGNLRVCTPSQNAMNRGPQSNNKSGYKGVIFDTERGKWKAQITFRGKRKFLGRFDDKEEAAKAYNEAALEYHGEFAYQNVIEKIPLEKFETGKDSDLDGMDGCITGACLVR